MTCTFARWAPIILALALSAVVPAPATAVVLCPAGAVCIDESVEGADPTVSSTSPLFLGETVTPQGPPETWLIAVTMQGLFSPFGNPSGLELIEPGTGSLSDSFGDFGSSTDPINIITVFYYDLFSDDELGNLAGRADTCPSFCSQALEDGTFQLAGAGEATTAGSFDVYLKSDLDPAAVPEPGSLALLAAAVAGLGLIPRRRRPA